MENKKKELVIKILEEHFKNHKDFKTDYNLVDKDLVEKVREYLEDYVNTDSKTFQVRIWYSQEKQYQTLDLKESGKVVFCFELSKQEAIDLIK